MTFRIIHFKVLSEKTHVYQSQRYFCATGFLSKDILRPFKNNSGCYVAYASQAEELQDSPAGGGIRGPRPLLRQLR